MITMENLSNDIKTIINTAYPYIKEFNPAQKAISLGIMAVPTIAINDEVVFVGAPVLDELVNKVKSLI